VLTQLAADPDARLRDVAARVGITERRAAQIVGDLEGAGYLTKTRVGRRNRYQIDRERTIQVARLPMLTIGQLLVLLLQAFEQPFV
jgi:DNA-binding MarR family transcriptional regulator